MGELNENHAEPLRRFDGPRDGVDAACDMALSACATVARGFEFLQSMGPSQWGPVIKSAGDCFNAALREIRSRLSAEDWKCVVEEIIRSHPVFQNFQHDPLTRRAYCKPRGYPGDAVLVDFLYRHSSVDRRVREASELGRALYSYTSNSAAARAARNRLAIVAAEIDGLASRRQRPDVLSIACGHMREVEACPAVRECRLGRFVGLDQDELAISVVRGEYGPLGVDGRLTPLFRTLAGLEKRIGKFDLVYCMGLFDYLPPSWAPRFMSGFFSLLKDGGKLVIGNFAPSGSDVAYMEAFMDWWLVYRDQDEMRALARALPQDLVSACRVHFEETRHIMFLEIERRTE